MAPEIGNLIILVYIFIIIFFYMVALCYCKGLLSSCNTKSNCKIPKTKF